MFVVRQMLLEEKLVWGKRFLFSGTIIFLVGCHLWGVYAPNCPLDVPIEAFYQRAFTMFSLYAIPGGLLAIFGLGMLFDWHRKKLPESG